MKERFSEFVKGIIDQDIEIHVKIKLIEDFGNKLLTEQYHSVINSDKNEG